jgi:hypothetical protein
VETLREAFPGMSLDIFIWYLKMKNLLKAVTQFGCPFYGIFCLFPLSWTDFIEGNFKKFEAKEH